jgi:hypothetical protein
MRSTTPSQNAFSLARPTFRFVFVLSLLTAFLLSACGGGESAPVAATADQVETGTPLQSGDWVVELTAPPEQVKVIGEGNITYQAEGTFLVVFLKITNQGSTLQIVPRNLIKVRDGEGQEYNPVRSAVQVAFVLQRGTGISLDSPQPAGETRESVIIYDIPAGSTGLELIMDGTDESLTLGF